MQTATRWIAATSLALAAAGLSACQRPAPSPMEYYLQGQLESQQGHMDAAIAALSLAIERNPDLGIVYTSRGQLYKKQGQYEKAAADFERGVTLEPANFTNHYELGVIYQQLKRFGDAIRAYQKALELRPSDAQANMNLAVTFAQTGDAVRGLPYARRAAEAMPKSAVAHANLGAVYAQMAADAPSAEGASDFRYLAQQEFKQSLELDPNQPGVYLNFAGELLKENRFEQARQTLEAAKTHGASDVGNERLGYAYYKLKDFPKAIESYRNALQLNPGYVPALNGLGATYMTQSLQATPPDAELAQQALKQWNTSLQIDPKQTVIKQLVEKYTQK